MYLWRAAYFLRADEVRRLLESGAPCDEANAHSGTPLLAVAGAPAGADAELIAQLLLDAKADIDALNTLGSTPLIEVKDAHVQRLGARDTHMMLNNAGFPQWE